MTCTNTPPATDRHQPSPVADDRQARRVAVAALITVPVLLGLGVALVAAGLLAAAESPDLSPARWAVSLALLAATAAVLWGPGLLRRQR